MRSSSPPSPTSAPPTWTSNEASADLGWRNGVWVANGNLVPSHLGIPTVTVPMGTMADIGMPVGITFAGRAYDDTALLTLAAAFEATGGRRTAPPRTPPLPRQRGNQVSGYRMPAESAPQDRVWMAFPSEGYSLGDTEQGRHEARATWAAVAHAVAEFEPVTMVIDPGERAAAQRYLSADIDVVEAPLNDAWMRDMGPTFVHADDGSVAAVDWVFNGWGAPGLGAMGPRREDRRVRRRPGRRAGCLVGAGERGWRYPGRRRGHRPGHRDRAARPRPQPGPDPGRRRGRAGPHDRGHPRGVAASRPDPGLRAVRHPRTRRHRRRDHRAGPTASAHPAS